MLSCRADPSLLALSAAPEAQRKGSERIHDPVSMAKKPQQYLGLGKAPTRLRLTPTGHLEPRFPRMPLLWEDFRPGSAAQDSELSIAWGDGSAGIPAFALSPANF